MSSAYGPDSPDSPQSREGSLALRQSLECQLFESLVHHLIEKGVMTRNDALSVVQTVAQVKRGVLEEEQPRGSENDIAMLKRLYSSFELMSDRRPGLPASDDGNVLQLRPPLHGNRPRFPEEN